MKKTINILFFLVFISSLNAATLVIEGKYQNKNLYVQNQYGGSGVGFCAIEVKVNGNITTDEVNSSAFEIDLACLKLKYGENVTVEIIHKDDCKPFVLNAEDLRPRPTFQMLTSNISSNGLLTWSTKGESGILPFIIEQYKCNKWVAVGEVNGEGTPDVHEYSFQTNINSGENRFRLKQIGLGSLPKYSNVIFFNSSTKSANYSLNKDYTAVQFNAETYYILYDDYGMIRNGFGKEIDIRNLRKGKYVLCFDNQVTEFEKKKK